MPDSEDDRDSAGDETADPSALFDANYYQTGLGLPYERNSHWLNFFGLMADEIIRSLKPRKVFDAGCALGFLVEAFWDRGVEAHGVDVSAFAISQVRRDMQPYCRQGSITDPIEGRYDLITCIEVLEHLRAEQTERAIASLAAASDTILFSSSPSDLAEATHFNVRPSIGWLSLFKKAGFWPDCVYDAGFIAPHAILLRKQPCLPEDVLALFNEKTRLKCALVEREQRIGLLDAKVAVLTQSVADHEQLRDQNTRLSAKSLEFARNYASVLNQLTEVRAEHDRMARERLTLVPGIELAESEAANVKWEGEIETARREAADKDVLLETARREAAGKDAVLETTRRELAASVSSFASAEYGLARARAQRELIPFKSLVLRALKEARLAVTLRRSEQLVKRRELLRLVDVIGGSHLFDPFWYLRNYPDVAAASQGPLVHYVEFGAAEGRNPGPLFDSGWYLDHYRDVAALGVNPLVHYLTFGVKEGREIRPVTQGRQAAPEPANGRDAAGSLDVRVEESAATNQFQPAMAVPETYGSWLARSEPGAELLELQRRMGRNLRLQPLISVIVPVYNVPLDVLRQMVDSVLNQTYDNWELCVVHGFPPDVVGREYLRSVAETDTRVRARLLSENLGISGNSNAALELAQGEFIALLDHDDTLAPFALFAIASAVNDHPDADLLYSDKDCVDEAGEYRQRPFFKPQWSPDILLSANYLTHLTVMRTKLVRAIGGWRSETDGAQDWDIFLRIADRTAKVVCVPGVLYHWRIIATSVASGGISAKPYVSQAQIRTVEEHAERRAFSAQASVDQVGLFKLEWTRAAECSVSVILVTSSLDVRLIEEWARRIDASTEWPNVEFILPGAASSSGRVRAVVRQASDSVAKYLNRAIQSSSGNCLVLLDDSIEISASGWLKELVGPMEQKEVAVVGPKLIDSVDHTLRHAGLVFNADGTLDYVFSREPEHICEQFGSANWYRNWSAVAGGCFAVRREAFECAGWFSETPDYPRHDVDLCLRVRARATDRIVYNPFARFFQRRSSVLEGWLSPDGPQSGAAYIRECFPAGDPYFHKSLESRSGKVLFAASKTGVAASDYAAESRALVGHFNATPETIEASKIAASGPPSNSLRRMTWVLPTFSHAFYGGIHTIFRFADYFNRAHGVESEFVFLGRVPEEIMRSRLAEAFPGLAANCSIKQLRTYSDWERVKESDATISTLWTTAYAALHFKNTRRKFYFVQDYESLFYPAGSTYALVEATYRFGYGGICNTRSLAETYREFDGEAQYFDPCIDPEYFFAPAQPREDSRPFTVFCYARPGHPRNCFELLGSALQKVKQRMGNDILILSAGAEWNPSDYGLEGVVENLGLLGYAATGALYRTCDMGVVMMMTRHPSYLPMELMACGALVVTNENRYTRWLLENEQNCLLSETNGGALAEVIERGLRDSDLRASITQRAAEHVRSEYSDWDAQTEKIYQYMVSKS